MRRKSCKSCSCVVNHASLAHTHAIFSTHVPCCLMRCCARMLFLRLSVHSHRPDFLWVSCQNLKGIYEELNKDGKKLEVESCVVWSNFIRRDLYYTRYNKWTINQWHKNRLSFCPEIATLRALIRPWMASPGLQFPLAKSVLLSKPSYLALGCVCVCVCARARRDSENVVGGMTEGVGCFGVTVTVAAQRSPSFTLAAPPLSYIVVNKVEA